MKKWLNIELSTLYSKDTDGVLFLQKFLSDYEKEFNIKANAGCQKCINKYLKNVKLKYTKMENSNFKLHKKREGLQVSFGSPVHVTNQNITDDLAKQLINRFKGKPLDFLFEKYPVEEIEVKEETDIEQPKRGRKRKSK